MGNEWQHLIDRAFYAIISGAIIYGIRFLERLTKSINELNIKIATILERIGEHDWRIRELEKETKEKRR